MQDQLLNLEEENLKTLFASRAAMRQEILDIVAQLMEHNSTPLPTASQDKVDRTSARSARTATHLPNHQHADKPTLLALSHEIITNDTPITTDSSARGHQVTLRMHDKKTQVLPLSPPTASMTDTQTWADLGEDSEGDSSAGSSRSENEESSSPDRKKMRVQPIETDDTSGIGEQ